MFYFAYFLAGFNSTLNASTIYAIYNESVVLEANSYFSWLYTVYNFMLSLSRQLVSDPLDYKVFIRMFLLVDICGICILLFRPKQKKAEKIKKA